MERLSHQLRLIIGQNIRDKNRDLTKILSVINEELAARENCSVTDEKDGKNYLHCSNSKENALVSGPALVTNQRFKNKFVFCKDTHWSDKRNVPY